MWFGRGRLVLAALVALGAAACDAAPTDVTLAQLVAEQEAYDGATVRTAGVVRSFPDPPHVWIEDADVNRVELVPASSADFLVGEYVSVEGRFTFRDDEGRRIAVDSIEVVLMPASDPGTTG